MSVARQKLSDGTLIPIIGFGLGTAHFGKTGPDGVSRDVVDTVKTALKVGYTHLDSAEAYGNEKSTGVAIEESGVPRESLFITTKALNGVRDLHATIRRQLAELRVSYVDLYLIHSPKVTEKEGFPSISEAWKVMEEIRAAGLAKSIGVSNFRVTDLESLLPSAKVKPVVNQIELNPYVLNEAEPLLEFMARHDIKPTAYGAGTALVHFRGGPLDPVVEKIAASRSLTPNQVLIQWALAQGGPVITTSGKDWRMKEQLAAAGGKLSAEEVDELAKAGKSAGTKRNFMKHMSE